MAIKLANRRSISLNGSSHSLASMGAPWGDSMEENPAEGEHFFSINHAERTFKKMQGYLHRRQLTDVVLIAGDVRIPAHRLVLSSVSDYFAAMFTNNLRESQETEIQLWSIDPPALKACIQYIYTGQQLIYGSWFYITSKILICFILLVLCMFPSNFLHVNLKVLLQMCYE